MKRYFVQYLEARDQLCIVDTQSVRLFTSFSKGVHVSINSGFSRMRDAIEHIGQVNRAAGKEIAKYYGPIDVKRGQWYSLDQMKQNDIQPLG